MTTVPTRAPGPPGMRGGARGGRKPWVGRSYAHLVLPVPHLADEHAALADDAVCADGRWVTVESEADLDPTMPVLQRRWRHVGGSLLVMVVLGWYPLLVTLGPDGVVTPRIRRAERRLTTAVLGAGGRTVPDHDLDRLLHESRARWDRVVAARRTIEEQRTWLECRRCGACGAWSAYGVLHCRGCARRFAPADDAERDERGRVAADVTRQAEQDLASLGRGEGLFADWPTPSDAGGPA